MKSLDGMDLFFKNNDVCVHNYLLKSTLCGGGYKVLDDGWSQRHKMVNIAAAASGFTKGSTQVPQSLAK